MIDLRPQPLSQRTDVFTQGIDPDNIALAQQHAGVALMDLVTAYHAFDTEVGVALLELRNRHAVRPLRHTMGAGHDTGVGNTDDVFVAGNTQLQFQLPGSSA
ncbi:hypothetical protein D3C79_646530 [compost metagenome]